MSLLSKVWRSKTRLVNSTRRVHSLREETFSRYSPGGYHPVRIGDTFNQEQYKVVSKLGYGLYSTVWLAHDTRRNRHVALKILTADCYGTKHDVFELDILRHIKSVAVGKGSGVGSNRVLHLLDDFRHAGPHGNHVCLVFKAMGPDLSDFRQLFPQLRLPVQMVKKIAKHLLSALDFIHESCGVIHTDLKPRNIMIETQELNNMFRYAPSEAFASQTQPMEPPNDFYIQSEQVSSASEDLTTSSDVSVRIADFGTASWTDKHLTEWIQPEKLRAPEVILGAAWDTKADIWNLGLLLWELMHGQMLFDGQATVKSDYSSQAHLAQMFAILEAVPISLLERSAHRAKFFDAKGSLTGSATFPSMPLEGVCNILGVVTGEDAGHFLEFMQSMLSLEPMERLSAKALLQSKWLEKA